MKARQSKIARKIFGSESKGRAIIKEIHAASKKNACVAASVKVGQNHIRVKEL